MAKIMSPLVGQGKGKIGAQVLYRANGEQLIRARAIEVKNPQSNAQMAQRIAVATVSKLTASLRGIVDHSFEGIPYGEKSVRFFNSKATLLLKAALINRKMGMAPVVPGDAPVGTCPNVPLSKGSLIEPSLQYQTTFSGNPLVAQVLPIVSGLTANATLGDFLSALGIGITDQLTFVWAVTEEFASAYSEEETFSGLRFAFARVNFKADAVLTTPVFVEVPNETEHYLLNSAILDLDKSSNYDLIRFLDDGSDMNVYFTADYIVPAAAAVIRSSYVNGDWRRSNTELRTAWPVFEGGLQDGYSAGLNYYSSVLECYRKSKTAVEDKYLNKEDN